MKYIQLSEETIAAYSEESEGNIDLRFASDKNVKRNLTTLCTSLGRKVSSIVQMEQVHATRVLRVGKNHQGKVVSQADGLLTDKPSVTLMLRLADCIPVFLFDPTHRAIGLLHTGWRGTIGKIILVAIEKMMKTFATNPEDLLVSLGPSIRPCCLVLSERPIQAQLPEWAPFVSKTPEGFAVDLPGFVVETAVAAGVKRGHIAVSPVCTVMAKNLFSHQRSQKKKEEEGRFAAVLSLKS